jgi:two-component system phosphate regulon sensor histidine kinase PhoR
LRNTKLIWQLLPAQIAIFLGVTAVFSWFGAQAVRESAGLASEALLLQKFGLVILIATALFAWLSFIAIRQASRPLGEMTRQALYSADHDSSERIVVSGCEEVVGLAQAMNRMVTQKEARLLEAVNRMNELETVVSSMVEGVIAFDRDANILYMNGAAARQLDVSRFEAQGGNILEVVRNIDLLRFIQKTIGLDEPVEGTVVLNRGREDERILQLHGAQLNDTGKKRLGALIVFNDVTRLLRLENLRRDFVANVSHELKTPITSIKGYVETLLGEEEEIPPHSREFLAIVLKQANRLQAIVEDLLTLSRIEQESRREEIRLVAGSIKQALAEAIESCATRAADKMIEIGLDCPDELTARINSPLLEQAVSNLLDNAIKYSRPESTVRIEAEATAEAVVIRVSDTGPGIPEQHLPRLFERFYVIDKARSRKMGGTGLGLAIVKHIVQSHGGQVTAASQMGQGSVFTITLPRT